MAGGGKLVRRHSIVVLQRFESLACFPQNLTLQPDGTVPLA